MQSRCVDPQPTEAKRLPDARIRNKCRNNTFGARSSPPARRGKSEPLKSWRIMEFPRFTDERGSLSVVDWTAGLPFEPKRLYYIFGVPPGARRGGHAHKIEHELILALSGSLRIAVADADSKEIIELNRPHQGLYLPPLIWHELYAFAPGAVCAVLASERYNADDYYREYEHFEQAVQGRRS
jgi:dTDP-4-dehydrorhamnose 3,5-epimerase-like enzyme